MSRQAHGLAARRPPLLLPTLLPLLLATLTGCAAAPETGRMIPTTAAALRQDSWLRGAVSVAAVGGGEETKGWSASQLGNPELEGALRATLDRCGYLHRGEGPAPFSLEAFIVAVKRPVAGITTTVDALIRYKLTARDGGRVLLDDILTSSASQSVADEYYGPSRLRHTIELAAQANLAALLERLDALARTPEAQP
jgi:hypothetical protein